MEETKLTLEEKKDCLQDEVWTQPDIKEYEGFATWSYPIMWGKKWIFDVSARNKKEAIETAIEIIAEEEWD